MSGKADDTLARTYREDVVYTSSEDDLLLEGALIRPVGVPIQAVSVVWIHGNAGRFYDYPYMAMAGYPCVSGNTPLLAFFGTRERGGEGTLETIRRQAHSAARVDTRLIEDADHAYTGHEADVAGVIARWAATLS